MSFKRIYDKFPLERKEEFLKWVMLTQPKDEWSVVTWTYIQKYKIEHWKEAFDFIIQWEPTDPSDAARYMINNGFGSAIWAMKVIENDKTGNPSKAAYWMVGDGYAEPEWAMKVIENATTGNPSGAAYEMVKDGHINDTEWAMKVIENAKTGYPSVAAYLMVSDGHAPQEWFDRHFIRRNT